MDKNPFLDVELGLRKRSIASEAYALLLRLRRNGTPIWPTSGCIEDDNMKLKIHSIRQHNYRLVEIKAYYDIDVLKQHSRTISEHIKEKFNDPEFS